jgi:hypothetical protein
LQRDELRGICDEIDRQINAPRGTYVVGDVLEIFDRFVPEISRLVAELIELIQLVDDVFKTGHVCPRIRAAEGGLNEAGGAPPPTR